MKLRKKVMRRFMSIAMIILLLLSSFSYLHIPIIKGEEVNIQTIRIHYEASDRNIEDLGVWLWDDVAVPSAESGEWPNGTWFSSEQVTEFGPYIEVELKEDAKKVGLKINNRTGEDVTDDILVDILSPQMQDIWIREDGSFYYYDPTEMDDNTLRVHYLRDDGQYEPWGVWLWHDVLEPSKEWSLDAMPFSNSKVGPYGAYVDIPLAESPEKVGLLLVTRDEAAIKTGDMIFNDVANHRQIFIKEGTDEIYTNPFFVSNEIQEEEPEEWKEGIHDIEVNADVSNAFTYNEHALLSVNINNPSNVMIKSIFADVSSLGGSKKLEISPELNQVTLSVSHEVAAGEKVIPITVIDEDDGSYVTETTAKIEPRNISDEQVDWDESIIYFMLTDRFYDGDQSNNDPYGIGYDSYDNPRGVYQGGDFQGIIEKLDYLDELGINTIWISPIVENIAYDVNYNAKEGAYFAYHGYWAKDFEKLNPHFGTLEQFHQLIDEAAERDIRIMVDVVLNHTGYGLKESDELPEGEPTGYPTNEDRDRFKDMIREEPGSNDEDMELSGLPDLKTEDATVREQIVNWQTAWLDKATTPKGNSISYFRVDTVKHVDTTTWQHFRNELTKKNPSFQLIGEAWGAGATNDQGYLQTGTMDSLLDFEFKTIARNFVNGQLEQAHKKLEERNQRISNTALLGQFLGSHDEDGFLYSLGGDNNKLMLAASLQMTAKGQPVIYYGEELGQSGKNNWPEYDNRYDFAWEEVENNEILLHYQKLLQFRQDHSDVLAKGDRTKIAGSDAEKYLLFERSLATDTVYVGLNTAKEEKNITLSVSDKQVVVTDHYSNRQVNAVEQEDGTYTVTLQLPSIENGGTALLTISNGTILGEIDKEAENPNEEPGEIEEGYLRVHFPGNNDKFNGLGLWIWEDVETPSEQVGAWPTGATTITNQKRTNYGPYVDIKLAEDAKKIGLLINNSQGENLSGDLFVDILSSEMNEIWLTEDYEVYLYEPLNTEENMIRVNFYQEEGSYDDYGLWTWGDVLQPTEGWPDGAHSFSENKIGQKGSYVDVPLQADAKSINFLVLNMNTDWQTEDLSFQNLKGHTQLFVRMGDNNVYTNPYFVKEEGLLFAEVIAEDRIELTFHSTESLSEKDLLNDVSIIDKEGNPVQVEKVSINNENKMIELQARLDLEKAPFTIKHNGREASALVGWRLKDEMYGYDGELGAILHDDGTADVTLWSPSADKVSIVLYDKDNPDKIINEDLSMSRSDKGVWSIRLNKDNTGLDDLTGYFYHYKIERKGKEVFALDPYAKSMAAWNSDAEGSYVGKAAIVNPSEIGPELDYAKINGFEKREDAIIYEVHVRDFTSDPSIDEELTARFGTFAAFVEKLDYIQDLGVTHIQLLPIMSYYFANEFESDKRLLEYSSQGNNYNWGYDPHSYFSITGMYSENPENPAKRIEEFKLLIDEIHQRGMGVILDVVYNHTAQTHIFEDLEPQYYHFMNADGTPRESFGGGRLGTTHKMARRILVDSITYWTEEFKVDGFRFDMMGDHDAESIEIAFNRAKELNPNILMIGEGWRTFAGDENYPNVQPADQDWMKHTDTVGVFSDEIRNELKSGFGSEGQPRFLTGGARNIDNIYQNIIANPGNFTADDPGDVVQYIAAHDNLTLHDVIAQSIKKDPKDHAQEIHQRIRLGNLIILTSQGTPFIHAGQEYGRTKQFRHDDYKGQVTEPPYKSTFMTDQAGNPFEYPYFIHDSYDSTDTINKFEWDKVTNKEQYPIETTTRDFTKGLIELRRSTNAFRLDTKEEIDQYVRKLDIPEIEETDLVVAYQAIDPKTKDEYFVFVNADEIDRKLTLSEDISYGDIIVAGEQAGITKINDPQGVALSESSIEIDALSAVVVRVTAQDDDDSSDSHPDDHDQNGDETIPSDPSQDVDKDQKGSVDQDAMDKSTDNHLTDEGSEQSITSPKGDKLPKTATNTFLILLLGCLSLALAGVVLAFRRSTTKS